MIGKDSNADRSNLRGALFLDRDGVLIEDRPDFVKRWEEVAVYPQAIDAVRRLSAARIPIVIATNQSLVGRGILTLEAVRAIHDRILGVFRESGGHVLASYMCPHKPEDNCDCRKPKPGMLLQAAKDLHLNLGKSVLVGDALRDLQAADAAGVGGRLVRTGKGRHEEPKVLELGNGKWPIFDNLLAATPSLIVDFQEDL